MANGRRFLVFSGLSALLLTAFSACTRANEIVSLTAATTCPAINGNGGNWCQGNGGPAFNLSSFTTQNISLTGSSAFFVIDNNTSSTITMFTLDFFGTLMNGALNCGGGGTGIQGSGPGSGSTTCSVSPITGGEAITWNHLSWGAGLPFDLQIASFSNGTTGFFTTPTPEPNTLLLTAMGMMVLAGLGASSKQTRNLLFHRS